jgi:hypothetical protein
LYRARGYLLICSTIAWRWWVIAVCSAFLISRTWTSITVDRSDGPLVLVLFFLMVGTAVLMPCSATSQGVLTVIILLSFAARSTVGTAGPC